MEYDPLRAPDPEQWLDLDEEERAVLVQIQHEESGEELENPVLHAMIHVVVENQLALADEVVVATLERLQREGLDRHDAIHAIASVLMAQIWQAGQTDHAGQMSSAVYHDALSHLTAKSWRAQE